MAHTRTSETFQSTRVYNFQVSLASSCQIITSAAP